MWPDTLSISTWCHCQCQDSVSLETYLNLVSAVPCQCVRRICPELSVASWPTDSDSVYTEGKKIRRETERRGRGRALNYVIWALRELEEGEVSASMNLSFGELEQTLMRNGFRVCDTTPVSYRKKLIYMRGVSLSHFKLHMHI